MELPQLYELETTREMINEFKGYNHNLNVGNNQFDNMQNMTSSFYPVLSPRSKRGKIKTFTSPNGLLGKDKLCWVDGTDFYYDDVKRGTVTDTKKQLISMGAYILIFPDKKYYNTNTQEFGSLENTVTTSTTVTFTLAKVDGTNYGDYTTAATAPLNPTNGQLWVDSSATPNVLKQYSESSGMWVSVATTYLKISATEIGNGFKKYDGVTISGCTNTSFNTDLILYGVSTDYIIVVGILNATFTQSQALTVKRKVPDMDFLTESDNRLWGCSSANHEIYSCKLGDPFNWYSYLGISTDSYAVTIGSDGDFTGACTHLGNVLFFKENVIHKLYGTKPANYQLNTINVRGVDKGSEKSLVIVNETLYYKAKNDICLYEGSMPSAISNDLGTEKYSNAVAGSVGNKYYISMKDVNDKYHLFVFDEKTALWHQEDNTQALYFARVGNELYYINASDKTLYSINGSLGIYDGASDYVGSVSEDDIEWFAESGDLGMELPDNKYISKLQVRLTVEKGSSFKIFVQYDSEPIWYEKFAIASTNKRTITIPIIPNRCDHMRIKFSGIGDCKVYSITKTIEQGSEL